MYTAGAVDITSVSGVAGSVLLFNTLSSVILSDPNISSNALIASGLCCAILSVHGFYHNCSFLPDILYCIIEWPNHYVLFFYKVSLGNTLPNVMTLDLAQVAT